MTQPTVASLAKDIHFEGFLLVRSAEQRTSNNGGPYIDLTLADRSGEINGKIWNSAVATPASGSVLKLRALVIDYNGKLQLRIEKHRPSSPQDQVDLSLLVAAAPEPAEDMLKAIDAAVDGIRHPALAVLLRRLLQQAGAALAYYPAAQRMHHAERSGLLHHMTSMLRVADAVLPCYPELDGDLVRAGIIVHDLSKIQEMNSDELGNVRDYTPDGLLLGHLVRGVVQIQQAAQAQGIPEDEEYVRLLQHMVISHHGEAEYGSPRPPMFPEAEMLHWIDVLDARMNEMQTVMRRLAPGVFSEKIWSLERRLYHPHYFQQQAQSALVEAAPAQEDAAQAAQQAYDGLL